jgi:hypothetical protein
MGPIIRLMAMVGPGSTRTVDTLTATGAVPASIAPTPISDISDHGRFHPGHRLHHLLPQACHRGSGAGNGLSCVKQPGKGGQ